jgi:hypothetical protein
MGLDELIARLQSTASVTPVTNVTGISYKPVRCNGSLLKDVTDVTNQAIQKSSVTPSKIYRNTDVTEKSLYNKAVTVVTDATAKNHSHQARDSAPLATSHWWLIHYQDRSSKKVQFSPGWAMAEVLSMYPGAITIEPDLAAIPPPETPLSAQDEHLLRAWLALIEETDPLLIDQTLERCRQDLEARKYFLGRAVAELPKPDPLDDRRPCTLCANFVQDRCYTRNAWYCQSTKTLAQRCKDYKPLPWDFDQRPGSQRWSL